MKAKLTLLFPFLGLIALLLNPLSMGAQRVFVHDDQISIQQSIDMAKDGDTIIVNEGTYYENIDFKGKAITLASKFILDSDPSHIEKTIINGSTPTDKKHAAVVSFISDEDINSVLCGFTITGGKGVYDPNYRTRLGGGILAMNAGATIINNRIIDNHVETEFRAAGGAICAVGDLTNQIIIRDNLIMGNSVTNAERYPGYAGGAGISVENIEFVIENNEIVLNTAHGRGFGAGIIAYNCNGVVYDNLIRSNRINATLDNAFGAGFYSEENLPDIEIIGNKFIDNEINDISAVQVNGGAICLLNTRKDNYNDVLIDRNLIQGNSAMNGAGIFLNKTMNTRITNNVIMDNYATNYGGGILFYSNLKAIERGLGLMS